ncbi:MAG: type I methionyl aminopeptidase [Clostridia bacterium]|nr:type I methionyl aminopeptidase [Clostridia bacterium]
MISIKSVSEIDKMRKAGHLNALTHRLVAENICDGVTTEELDRLACEFIKSKGAVPSFLNYGGYPKSICISVNDVVIHGIPGKQIIKTGDIVSVDVGVYLDGYHSDSAATYPCGKVSEEAQRLIDVTKQSFYEGIKFAREGNRVSDISCGVQTYVEQNGFSVVTDYVGHGVGRNLHEDPEVPNFGKSGKGARLYSGMTLAVEPMVNAGTPDVKRLKDGWTVITADGKLSAHYEHTIAVTKGNPILLTVE